MASVSLDQVGIRGFAEDGSLRWLLEDVSITCRCGERIGLIGPNGSGKTTLARLISGLDKPSAGTVHIEPFTARVVPVFQRPEDHFIRETVGRQIASYASKRLSGEKIQSLMNRVGLSAEAQDAPPLRLSGGQQRLTAIACALAADADVIILDEPMAGLDGRGRYLVRRAMNQISYDRNVGLILISHHPDDLLGLADRLWILNRGHLDYDGPLDDSPVELLEEVFSTRDTSLFLFLRQVESRGLKLPREIYLGTEAEQIAKYLLGAGES